MYASSGKGRIMSFADTVKRELAAVETKAYHCREAELLGLTVQYRPEGFREDIVRKNCCRRAFLRGLFLASGTVNDPEKSYQMEIRLPEPSLAEAVKELVRSFDLNAKMIERRNGFVVYLKEGDDIADFLVLIGANLSVLDMENIRVVKDVRNRVNRRVNCETANLNKSVKAGMTQAQAIQRIEEHIGLINLPDSLREIAELRLAHPDSSLQELGEMTDPPVGRSGVNHRLRRLMQIAEEELL